MTPFRFTSRQLLNFHFFVSKTISPRAVKAQQREQLLLSSSLSTISYEERQRRRKDKKHRATKYLYLMNSAIKGAEQSGQWKKALEWFDSLESRGLQPNSNTYSMVIGACEKAQQWEKVIEIYTTMKEQQVEPDERTHEAVIRSIDIVGTAVHTNRKKVNNELNECCEDYER